VSDDIRLTSIDQVAFSPNNRYFVTISQRGRLDLNRPESCLRIYRSEDVRRLLNHRLPRGEPLPIWNVCRAAFGEAPNIADVRWLRDSTALAFLGKSRTGNDQIFLADVSSKKLEALTPDSQQVTGFDVRSRDQFVYTALSPVLREASSEWDDRAIIVGTGRALNSLVLPHLGAAPDIWKYDLSELWVINHAKRSRVMDASTGRPVPIHLEGERALSLSPDGRQIVTALTIKVIPKRWESLYSSPVPFSPYSIRAKLQNPEGFRGQRDVSQYSLIDVKSGKVEPLMDAPIGNALGWWGMSHADWSADARFIVLTDTFLPPNNSGRVTNEPCVVVVELVKRRTTCLIHWPSPAEAGVTPVSMIYNASFDSEGTGKVNVYKSEDGKTSTLSFARQPNNSWVAVSSATKPSSMASPISVAVEQGINQPPLLAATDPKANKSSVIWNPNAWTKGVQFGEVSIYRWTDKTGREWTGGLYIPPNYIRGKRYPLVIQTHGFDEHKFAASGSFPTAFAAQELVSAGIIVLQVRDCPIRGTPEEASCQLAGYESAIDNLSAESLVDPSRIGIIGFSRTCYYVLAALTVGNSRFAASSITDGVDEGYLQYILNVDGDSNNSVAREADAIIGAPPFGQGIRKWLQRSPAFNMDKVNAPLQVIATREGVLQMWEPYAALRYLRKPVDLLILNSNEHVLSKPSVRLVSQGATVDWFRFWLQGYADPDPAKSSQYQRWEQMRTARDEGRRIDN
jgi:hypothetical protein